MDEQVTVLIPVGPNYNPEWLQEAFDSAVNQTVSPKEIMIIDDGANLYKNNIPHYPFMPGSHLLNQQPTSYLLTGKHYWYNREKDIFYSVWFCPANVGFTAAFNLGMALADNDLVIYLASDDKLLPEATEKAVETYLENDKKDAWYAFSYIDSDGIEGDIPNNAAMITRKFWKMIGGYPPAAFVGPDAAVLSCLMVHAPDRITHIDKGNPLYWIRNHDQQETKIHTWNYVDEMNSIRNKLTANFKLREIE